MFDLRVLLQKTPTVVDGAQCLRSVTLCLQVITLAIFLMYIIKACIGGGGRSGREGGTRIQRCSSGVEKVCGQFVQYCGAKRGMFEKY